MSRHAWLTPDDAPGAAQCRTVFIPGGLHYEAAFRGAYLLLCNPENWERVGAQTPEACADAFQAAFFQTLDNWEVCPVIPIMGEIRLLTHNPEPASWFPCDGAFLAPGLYPELFAAIGYTFGSGIEQSFALPDLRGRVVVGTGSGGGLTPRALADQGGEETHVLIDNEMPAHDHTINHNHAGSRSYVSFAQGTGAGDNLLRDDAGSAIVTASVSAASGAAGSDAAHENMPPFIALDYYIYVGDTYA